MPRPRPTRRDVLGVTVLAALATSCARPKTRHEVLRALMSELSHADQRAVETANANLVTSLQHAVTGTGNELVTVHARFREALLAWRTASCLPAGPLVVSQALLRAQFWPVRLNLLQTLAIGSSRIDERAVRELGVDQKGLFAIEFLLFGSGTRANGSTPPAERPGAQGVRARALCLAFAENVAACAKNAAIAPSRAPQPESDANVALSQLVSHMSTTLGAISTGRLSKAFSPEGYERPSEIQGLPSGTAYAILEALVRGMERIYLGDSQPGLTVLVASAAPDCDRHLRGLFRTARAALQLRAGAIVRPDRLIAAREAVRSLDVAVETELASSLGVTLAFAGSDAD